MLNKLGEHQFPKGSVEQQFFKLGRATRNSLGQINGHNCTIAKPGSITDVFFSSLMSQAYGCAPFASCFGRRKAGNKSKGTQKRNGTCVTNCSGKLQNIYLLFSFLFCPFRGRLDAIVNSKHHQVADMPAVAGACTPKLNKALKIEKKARIKQIIKRKIPVATMTSVPDHKCNTVKGATATSLYPISCQTAGSSRKREEMSVTPSSSRVNNLTQVKNKRKTIRFHCRRVMNRASPLMRACPEKDVDELAGVGQPIAQYKHTHTRGKSRTLQLRIAAAQEGKRSMKCYSKKGSFSPLYFVLAPAKDCSI